MKRFKKLSSILFLLLAFIYPPALAEAKDNTLNNVLNEQSIDAETNLIGDKSGELLLAHRRTRRRYHRRQRNRHYYYQRHRRHYYRRHYRYGRYHGQPYRNGEWKLVHDRHGRFMYEWRRY